MKIVSYKCPKCGHSYNNVKVANDVTWRFCTTCGERVEIESPTVSPAVTQPDPVSAEARLEHEIRMREIKLEEDKLRDEKKARNSKFAFSVFLTIIGILLMVFGLLAGDPEYNIEMYVVAAVGVALAVFGITVIFKGGFKKPRS